MNSSTAATRVSAAASSTSPIGSPRSAIRSLTRVRSGLVYEPVERPTASSSAAIIRVAEVLPFVPVRCTAGNSSWGEPSSSVSARMRSSVGATFRRSTPVGDADAGLEVDVRGEPGQRFACGSTVRAGSRAGSSASSTSTANASPATVSSAAIEPGAAHVGRDPVERGQPLRRVGDGDVRDLGAHRAARLGLRLAHRAEHLGRDDVVERRRRRRPTHETRPPAATTAGAPNRPATTTRPLRSRSRGTARTGAAARRARSRARRAPSRRRSSPIVPYARCFTSSR